MQSRSVRIATTVAVPAFVNWSSSKLYQRHPRWATALRIVAVAIPAALTVNNLNR